MSSKHIFGRLLRFILLDSEIHFHTARNNIHIQHHTKPYTCIINPIFLFPSNILFFFLKKKRHHEEPKKRKKIYETNIFPKITESRS
jgi:hypothetical protein